MGPPWASAFLAALAVSLVATPALRRLALARGVVDRPDLRKSHLRPVAYLGGVGIMGGVLAGVLFLPRLGPRGAALTLAAVGLGAIGLFDDDRTVHPGFRLGAEVGAAAIGVAAGLRVHATGIEVLDMALTMVWIVGITNALNLLDNMDGLAGGVAAWAGVAVFLLAVLNRQEVAATLSAALVGACAGFLVFNRPPASIFMGDAGSLFLGFVLAVLTIDVNPGLGPPASFAVPVILLGLAVLDTSMVTLARLRRGRSVSVGGRDHLSHRLVALGLSSRAAVGVLVSVQVVLTVLAVLAGRKVLPLGVASAAAGAVLAVLAATAGRARVYEEPVLGMPSWLPRACLGGAAVVVVMAGPAVAALARADRPARQASALAAHALASAGEDDPARTRSELERAEVLFRRARARLHGPLASLGLAVPGVSANLRAARVLTEQGAELSDRAASVAGLGDAARLPVAGGSIETVGADTFARALEEGARVLVRTGSRLDAADRAYLVPGLRRALRDLADQSTVVAPVALRVAQAARLLPGLLGEGDSRRYLLVLAAGEVPLGAGPVTAWGELVADDGGLRLERAVQASLEPRPASPDFPTAARSLSDRLPMSDGRPAAGVVAVDAQGLSALAALTDPLEPVNAGDGGPARPEAAAEAVWRAMVTRDLGTAGRVVDTLAGAAQGGHLLVYLRDAAEEKLVADAGLAGEISPVRGDSVIVVGRPLAGDPAPAGMRQTVSYDVRLDPARTPALLTGEVSVTVRDDDPADPDPPGRTEVSVYTPFRVGAVALDGRAVPAASGESLGRTVRSATIDASRPGDQTLRLSVAGEISLGADGWYRLDVLSRVGSGSGSDPGHVRVSVPRGWRIVEARGLTARDSRHFSGPVPVGRERSLWVRIERAPGGELWDKLLGRD